MALSWAINDVQTSALKGGEASAVCKTPLTFIYAPDWIYEHQGEEVTYMCHDLKLHGSLCSLILLP